VSDEEFSLADLGIPLERDLIGEALSGCRIERLLGRGGMGAVYLARREADGAAVCVKVLAPEVASDPGLRDRFEREWSALAKVDPPHPNLVGVHGVGADPVTPHIVMEFVEGHSLRRLLQERGRLEPELTARVGLDLARGLSALHGLGLVHRDVKPDNVLLTPAGSAKLVDFGIAKDLFRSALTQPGQLVGTAAYMSPEQWDEVPLDGRADVFALGALLYHLLAGEPPFAGEDLLETADLARSGDYEPLRDRVPGIPRELELVLARALLPELRYRYASCGSLARDLELVLRGQQAEVPALITVEGARFPLLPARRLTLGADEGCAIRIGGEGVAPRHAQVRREAEGFTLRALRGAGPVEVDDQPLQRGQILRPGQRIRLGTVTLTFSEERPPDEARPAIARASAQREVSDAELRALIELDDPRTCAHLLESLQPTPWVEDHEEGVLREALGPEVARSARQARGRAAELERARLPRRLAAVTRAQPGQSVERWLGWWLQVRQVAPTQLWSGGRTRAHYTLRVTTAEGAREAPLESGLLVGRDPRCDLRLDTPARLQLRILPLQRRLLVRAEAPGVTLDGRPLPGAAFLEPGSLLGCPGAELLLLHRVPPPAEPSSRPEVEPETFAALLELGHPAVALALLELRVREIRLDELARQLGPSVPADSCAQALEAVLSSWRQGGDALLQRLFGQLLDPKAAADRLRRGEFGTQVLPRQAWPS
jgi:protein kinase-like protein/type III secretion system (T3SS) inner membrane Yop/YscD-like protein